MVPVISIIPDILLADYCSCSTINRSYLLSEHAHRNRQKPLLPINLDLTKNGGVCVCVQRVAVYKEE